VAFGQLAFSQSSNEMTVDQKNWSITILVKQQRSGFSEG